MSGIRARFREWYSRQCWREPWRDLEWGHAFQFWMGEEEPTDEEWAEAALAVEDDRAWVLEDLKRWNARWGKRPLTTTDAA